METKRCISSLTLEQLTAELKAMGQPGFRAKQIFHWVHQKLVTDFSAMTDQPKALLAKLEEAFYIAAPIIERRQEAKDGTVKYLLRMADGNCIETVVMRYHYGNTVCVSTQVGCRMGCRFCASTQAGRVRNLEAGEICSEIYTAQKDIGERISHIVLMGIGEPLDNFDEVMRFLENISSPEGVNIGMRNISLSTCGLVPKIDQLAEKKLQLTLSVSLHAPNNDIRSGMMPVNDAYPVEVLMQAVRRYQETTGRRVSFEYSMVRGVNDSDSWPTSSGGWALTSTSSPSTRWTAALIRLPTPPTSGASSRSWKASASTPPSAAVWAARSAPPAASSAATR